VWLGATLFLIPLWVDLLRSPRSAISSLAPPAVEITQKLGPEALVLLRHQSFAQIRSYINIWELAQFALGVALGACLLHVAKKRAFPVVLGAAMISVVVFQHFALTPELSDGLRATDLASSAAQNRVLGLSQTYVALEAVKFVLGGLLTGYLFAFRSETFVRKRVQVAARANRIDAA
jgi:hypothetical protein